MRVPEPIEFMPLGIIGRGSEERPPLLAGPGQHSATKEDREDQTSKIAIDLANGARVRVHASVSEKALMRVLRALKAAV